jgi:hypothetical protein
MSDINKLAERLDYLERRIQELERVQNPKPTLPPGHDFGPVDTWPYRPMVPVTWPVGPIHPPRPTEWRPSKPWDDLGSCSKCGIKLSPVMGYVCSRVDCPTGLGGSSGVGIAAALSQDPIIGN